MSNKPNIPDLPNQKDYKNLTPFDLALIQRFPFIEEDFDSINLYGILSKIKDYLNNVIANEQIVTENQENVYNSFTDLHNYVEDYFTNLEVQEEINNKLDEMVESGTFSNILKPLLKPEIDLINERLTLQDNKINIIESGSPLVATSVDEMIDTSRIYVNTTDGKWYYYNGTNWTIGGTYQSSGIAENQIKTINLDTQIINKYNNLIYKTDHSNLNINIENSFSDTNNHAIMLQSQYDVINLPVGNYFVGAKFKVVSKTQGSRIRFRAGIRLSSTNKNVVSFVDARSHTDELSEILYAYGFVENTQEQNARTILMFTNDSGTNPIDFDLLVLDSYVIPVESVSDEIRDDIIARIKFYNEQKSYPILNLTENDKLKITKEVQEEIDNINDNINNNFIPDYVFQEKENVIENFEPPAKSLSLIFQTDLHSNDNEGNKKPVINAINLANELIKNIPISVNIFGGDYVANGSSTTKKQAKKYMEDLIRYINTDVPTVLLRGNHDCNQLQNNESEIMSDLEVFNIIGKKFITNNLNIVTNNNIDSPLYGYIDFDFQKIRVVFVNTSDGYDQNLKIGMGNMNTTQLQWLADNAFDLTNKEDYQVIVFGHYPIYNFDDETTVVEQGRLSAFKDLLLAFKNGTNLSSHIGGSYQVIKDFRNQGAKTLIAYICGHVHDDKNINTTNGILQVSSTNEGYYGKENDGGTINELAFDIISIDTIQRNLHFTRVGKGLNRTFNY